MSANLSNEQINGLKAGIQDIMQGLLTVNKVLTMVQVPESAKYPDGRTELHDAHVQAFKRHHGIHNAHVQAYERQSDKNRSEPRSSFQKGTKFRAMIL